MFKPLLALFAFCSEAVPTYSTRSQNTKFISLSRSLPAFKLLFLIAAIAIRPAGGERILPHEVSHAACFAHGVIQMAQGGSQVV